MTLIYLYYTKDEKVKHQKALSTANNSNTFISTQVLTELSNTLNKKFKLDWKTIEIVISEVSSDFNVYVNKPSTIEYACWIADKYQYSFYDSLIISSALLCNFNTLYSEDMQDGQIIENKLQIINPLK